jgi:hypothetical protein
MNIYLPIAEMSQNVLVLLAVGGLVGLLSGIFGVGGGFLLTPLLIFLGIPSSVAVASAANQVLGASVSGALGHWRRGTLDAKMGLVLLLGGLAGSAIGVWIFGWLQKLGYIDLAVSLAYIFLLGTVGLLMLAESLPALISKRRGGRMRRPLRGPRRYAWMNALPLKLRFRKSRLFVSAIIPGCIGALVGLLSAVMGVGGGFVMVPAMIYLIGMPTDIVVGTSLFQIVFLTAGVTLMHAVTTQSVDVVLAMLLLLGGVTGAQLGLRIGAKLASEELRVLLALLVLAVGGRILFDMVVMPIDLYSVSPLPAP